MPATIVTRTGKGSPLTIAELDANLTNLNNVKYEDTDTRATIRPSLLLAFDKMKKLDPRITFTRSSAAKCYDGKTTVKAEENLLPYSQDYTQSSWTKNNTTITANTVVAPDGTTTASTLAGNAGTLAKTMYCNAASTSIVANNLATQTFFVKYNTQQFVQLYVGTYATDYVNFDLVNGLATAYGSSTTTGSITNAGNGWWRISMTWLYAAGVSTGGSLCLVDSLTATRSSTSTSTNSIYIWGSQLEQRAYATAYTPTTTAAITNYIPALQSYAANVARFDFNPVTGESLGLMVEEQRTNLLWYSQDMSVPTWIKDYSLVRVNLAIAPDGTLTANKFIPDATSNYHRVYQAASSISGSVGAHSAYVKAGELTKVALRETQTTGNYAVFDLSAGTVIAGYTATTPTITPVGNGWYRISIAITTASQAWGIYGVPNAYTTGSPTTAFSGDGYSGLYVWGAQLEAGAFATSYIPTLLTYSGRGSTATYIGDNGLIQTAAANVARYQRNVAGAVQLLLEGAGTNLAAWTADLANISIEGSAYVLRSATAAPDGTMRGNAVYARVGAGYHSVYCSAVGGASAGVTYTASVFVKKGSTTYASVFDKYDVVWHVVVANLDTGTIVNTNNATGTITPYANGWYQITATFTRTNAGINTVGVGAQTTTNAAGAPNFTAVGTEFVYAWGLQLETGSVATSYIPSTETFTGRSGAATYFDPSGVMRTAPAGLARYDFDPVTGLSKGLMAEASSINMVTYSSLWTNAIYGNTGISSVNATAVTAPDGTMTGNKLIENSSTSVHASAQAVTVLASTVYTLSVYMKAAERTTAVLMAASLGAFATVNLTTGVITTTGSVGYINSSIQPVNNGWYRVTLTYLQGGAGSQSQAVYINQSTPYAGDGTSGIYVWGLQLEAGYVATSYIPTAGSQVTRAADSATSVANSRAADVWSSAQATRSVETASIIGSGLTALLPLNEYTLYAEGAVNQGAVASTNYHFVTLTDSAGSNYAKLRIQGNNMGAYGVVCVAGSVTGPAGQGTISANAFSKMALGVKVDSYAFSYAGTAVSTLTGAIPKGIDRMYIGTGETGSNQMINGTIKRIAFYPKRLTNTELQNITS